MVKKVKALLVLGAFAMASAAYAQPTAPLTAKCSIAKMKCAAAYVKGALTCWGTAAKKGDGSGPACITAKVEAKWSNGGSTGCIDKANTLFGATACSVAPSDTTTLHTDVVNIVNAYLAQMYPDSPTLDTCAAGMLKCASGLYTGLESCDAKAIAKGLTTNEAPALPAPPGCTGKVLAKFTTPLKGCVDKLTAVGKACATPPGGASQVNTTVAEANTDGSLNKSECQQMSDKGATPADGVQIVLQPGVGNCGQTLDPASNPLICGDLYVGSGSGTTPPGATPPGSTTKFDLAGGLNRVCPRTATEEGGSNRHCTDVGCFFGSPLPIVNAGLSTCVDNVFAAQGFGHLNNNNGSFTGDVLLASNVTVTGNATQPCPHCVGGFCDATAGNSGAACVADATTGESHDCTAHAGSIGLSPFPVNLNGLTTGSSTKTDPGGIFCPGQNAGAFGDAAVTTITTTGATASNLPTVMGSVFCIPATGNVLIDGAAGLPGPGAVSLPVATSAF